MELFEATEAFTSLSQETRLKVFKILIEYGQDGLVPGKLSARLKIPDNTLSFHLSQMVKAGLVTSKRNGRFITYFANTELIEDLIGFLKANCCIKEKSKARRSCAERSC